MILYTVALDQLKDLKKKRVIVKAALTCMKIFMDNFDPTVYEGSLLEFR